MSFPTVPWALALVFILALVLVARLKSLICKISRPSYQNLSWGLILLAIFSLAKVYHELGTMASVPFVSEATFFQIIYGIGMISGMVYLLSGVSEFLPLSTKHRQYDETRLVRIELIKRVEQLVGVENRLDYLMQSSLTHIIESFDFSYGAVFKFSSRLSQTRLAAVAGEAPEDQSTLGSVSFNADNWNGSSETSGLATEVIDGLPDGCPSPHTFVPLLAANEPVGFFLLWSDRAEPLGREDQQILKIVADIISRKILSDRNGLRYDFLTRAEALGRRLRTEHQTEQALKDMLQICTATIEQEVDFSMLSLTLLDGPGGSHRRLTVGQNGAVLDERGLAPSERRAISAAVLATGEPFIVDDYDPDHALIGEDILDSGTMKSALCVPITDDHRIVAILMVADAAQNCYRKNDAVMLSYAAPAIAQMIRDENYRTTLLRREKRISRISQFIRETKGSDSFDRVAQAASELIADELATCQVRVSLIEDHGSFLKSCGLASKRELPVGVPIDGQMILSLMPCHSLVMNSGRQLIVNQTDVDSASMPESESSQALNSNLNSALIVPIIKGERVIGMISVAEMRNWQRFQFDQADILFTEALAEILSLSDVSINEDAYRLPTNESRISEAIISDPVGRSRVRSSLTGILGSIELIKSPGATSPAAMKRYLSLIDSSARQINDCLTG